MLVRTYRLLFLVILKILKSFKSSYKKLSHGFLEIVFEDLIYHILQIFMKAKKNVKKSNVNIEWTLKFSVRFIDLFDISFCF